MLFMSFATAAEVVCVMGKGAITAIKTIRTHKRLRLRQMTNRGPLKACRGGSIVREEVAGVVYRTTNGSS